MISFVVSLAVTVAALVAAIVAGVTRRRHAHYALVVATLASLAWAIVEAKAYGRGLVFEGVAAQVKTVHFVAVTITFALLPVVALTGARLHARECPDRRRTHRKVAWAFVAATLVAFVLGFAMTVLATPVDGAGG